MESLWISQCLIEYEKKNKGNEDDKEKEKAGKKRQITGSLCFCRNHSQGSLLEAIFIAIHGPHEQGIQYVDFLGHSWLFYDKAFCMRVAINSAMRWDGCS